MVKLTQLLGLIQLLSPDANDHVAKFLGPKDCPLHFSPSDLHSLYDYVTLLPDSRGICGRPPAGNWTHPRYMQQEGGVSLKKIGQGVYGVVLEVQVVEKKDNADDSQNHSDQSAKDKNSEMQKQLDGCKDMVLKVMKWETPRFDADGRRNGGKTLVGSGIDAEVYALLSSSLLSNQTGILGFQPWQTENFSKPVISEMQQQQWELAANYVWSQRMDTSLDEFMTSPELYTKAPSTSFSTIASQLSTGLLKMQTLPFISKGKRLLHTDIKPDNIMLKLGSNEKLGNDGPMQAITEARFVDWDLARLQDPAKDLKYGMGAERFNSPRGHTDDTFALGITFAELYFAALDAEEVGQAGQEPLLSKKEKNTGRTLLEEFRFIFGSQLFAKDVLSRITQLLEDNLGKSKHAEVNHIGHFSYGILRMHDLECFSDMEHRVLKHLMLARVAAFASPEKSKLRDTLDDGEPNNGRCEALWSKVHNALQHFVPAEDIKEAVAKGGLIAKKDDRVDDVSSSSNTKISSMTVFILAMTIIAPIIVFVL